MNRQRFVVLCFVTKKRLARTPLDSQTPALFFSSVVIVGDHLPPEVHALAHKRNADLGNVGKTVFYTDPVDAYPV